MDQQRFDQLRRIQESVKDFPPYRGGPSTLYLITKECLDEIERLQRGDFTEEEFQNLCHKFQECDAKRFRLGCNEYFKKLFGYEPKEIESNLNEPL